MINMLIIVSIITGVVALIIEILCTDQGAKLLWLGGLCFFYLANCAYFYFVVKDASGMSIPKQIFMFLAFAILAAIVSLVVASVILTLTKKKDDEEEDKDKEKEKDATNEEKKE